MEERHPVLSSLQIGAGFPGPDRFWNGRGAPPSSVSGRLFPYLCTVREIDRANEFRQRCVGLGIVGIKLYSYCYSWARRAKAARYPQRYAQQALRHVSKAVTEVYAPDAKFILSSLEEFDRLSSQPPVRAD
jgi:hypothetical protein